MAIQPDSDTFAFQPHPPSVNIITNHIFRTGWYTLRAFGPQGAWLPPPPPVKYRAPSPALLPRRGDRPPESFRYYYEEEITPVAVKKEESPPPGIAYRYREGDG